MPAPSSKAGAATTTPSGLIRAWAGRRHWPSRQTGTVRACNGTGRSRDLGLRALSHCVGCSNHIQSANDSNFPWLKVGGQVTPSGGSNWRVFFFEAMGRKVRLNRRLCPKTAALIDSVPKVFQACFSILEPKKSVPAHCGLYNGYLRYHLGIEVPRQPRLRFASRISTTLGRRAKVSFLTIRGRMRLRTSVRKFALC